VEPILQGLRRTCTEYKPVQSTPPADEPETTDGEHRNFGHERHLSRERRRAGRELTAIEQGVAMAVTRWTPNSAKTRSLQWWGSSWLGPLSAIEVKEPECALGLD
jgi:hypothetical protein